MKREKMIKAFLQEMPWLIDCLRSSAEAPKDADMRTCEDHVAKWMIRNIRRIYKVNFTMRDVNRREFKQTCQTVRFDDRPFEPFYRRSFVFCFRAVDGESFNIYMHIGEMELTIEEIFQQQSYRETEGKLISVVQVETIGILGECSTNILQVLLTQL